MPLIQQNNFLALGSSCELLQIFVDIREKKITTHASYQGISIEYVLGIQYFEKVLVLDIQYILRRSIGKSINTFRLEIQYPILFSRIFQSFQSKNSKFSRKI